MIVQHMKQGLEGPSSAVRLMTLKVISGGNTVAQWKMAQANGTANGAHWMLTVVLAPPEAKGIAFLDKDQPGATSAVNYAYLPVTKRVLEFSPIPGLRRLLYYRLQLPGSGLCAARRWRREAAGHREP